MSRIKVGALKGTDLNNAKVMNVDPATHDSSDVADGAVAVDFSAVKELGGWGTRDVMFGRALRVRDPLRSDEPPQGGRAFLKAGDLVAGRLRSRPFWVHTEQFGWKKAAYAQMTGVTDSLGGAKVIEVHLLHPQRVQAKRNGLRMRGYTDVRTVVYELDEELWVVWEPKS